MVLRTESADGTPWGSPGLFPRWRVTKAAGAAPKFLLSVAGCGSLDIGCRLLSAGGWLLPDVVADACWLRGCS